MNFLEYEVVANDSIYGIAEKFNLKPETILYCNDVLLGNPAFIRPGQILEIPPTDGVLHTWHEGEGLNGVSNGLGVTPEDIIEWPGNNLNPATIGDYANPNIEVGTKLFAPGGYKGFTLIGQKHYLHVMKPQPPHRCGVRANVRLSAAV